MKNTSGSTRRDFLKATAAASAAIGVPTFIPARVLGLEGGPSANEQIIIGAIRIGRRCNRLCDQVPETGRVVAVADCFLKRAQDAVNNRKVKWAVYQDYQQMLDKEKLDAVIIATPDHVRTLPCVHAVQRGLDVYAEKPLTVYI